MSSDSALLVTVADVLSACDAFSEEVDALSLVQDVVPRRLVLLIEDNHVCSIQGDLQRVHSTNGGGSRERQDLRAAAHHTRSIRALSEARRWCNGACDWLLRLPNRQAPASTQVGACPVALARLQRPGAPA